MYAQTRTRWTASLHLAVWCLSLLFAANGFAQQTLVPIGQLPGDSFRVEAMAVRANYAFATGSGVILATYDLSSRNRLGILLADDDLMYGYHVALVGNYAYVLIGSEGSQTGLPGIVVVDISNPSSPRRVGAYGSGASSFDGFVVHGNVAYTSRGRSLHVLDLSNPANPQLVRTVPLSGALDGTGGTVVGNRLYLCEGTAGFSVWDVSQPDNPTRLGIVQNIGVVRDVVVVGNHAFLSCGQWLGGIAGALRVVDVSDPAQMSVVAQLRLGNPPFYEGNPWYPLVRKDNYLFVALLEKGSVSIVDISQPRSPQALATGIEREGRIGGASVPDNRLITTRGRTFAVWDISNATTPVKIGSYFGIEPQAATRVNNWLLTAEQGGVAVYDVTIPTNPSRASFVSLPNSPTGNQRIVAQGDLVVASFLSGGSGGQEVHLFNAANLPTLLPVSSYSPLANVYGIALQRPFLLVAHGSGLDVVRVQDPSAPVREARIPANWTNYPLDVAVSAEKGCVVTYDRKLKTLSVGALPSVTEEATLDLPFLPSDVEIAGNWALVAGDGKLMAVDISDLRNPRPVASWDPGQDSGGATRVQVYDTTALLSYYRGLAVFDLGQLPSLSLVAMYDGYAVDAVRGAGDVVFAVAGERGVLALQGRLPEGTSDLQVRAVRFSPTDPADLMEGVTVTIEADVFNAGPEGTLAPPVRFVIDGQTVDTRVRGANLPAGQTGTAVARWTLRPGSGRSLRVIVDPDNRWNDPIRTNNVQTIPFPDLNRADLSVAEMQVQPQMELVHGEEFTVRALVRNGGGGVALPVPVRIEYGGKTALLTINGLRAGAQEAVAATFTASSGQTQIRVKVDPDNSIEESAEDNNELVQNTPPIATPDLQIVSLTFAPAQPDEGDTVRVTAKVRNNGTPIKGGFTVAFTVDDRLIYNEPSPQPYLGSGEEMEVSQHFTFTSGSRELKAVADPGNQIVESNEDNNTFTVSLPQPASPELEVRNLTLTQPVQAGIWQTARAEIANNGGTVRAVKVQFLVNGSPISTKTLTVKRATTETVETSWRMRAGTREVKVVVDPDQETSDPQRDNNSRSLPVDLPTVDVAVDSVQLPRRDFTQIAGPYPYTGLIPVQVQLRNNSDSGTGTFSLGVFADGKYVGGTSVHLAGREQKLAEVWVPLRSLIGKQQLRVKADVNDVLLEPNEQDNERTVSIPSWLFPDLEVVDVTWTPQEFRVGQTVTFHITVRNRGQGRYGLIAWGGQQYKVPVVLTIGSEVVASGLRLVGVLAPGESQTVQVSWTAHPIDNPEVAAQVDSSGWLVESDESNNALRKPLPLRLASPDFAVTDVQVTPTTGLNVGDPVTVRATVAHVQGEFDGLTDVNVSASVDGRGIGAQRVSLRAGEEKEVEFVWQALPGTAHNIRVELGRHSWETNTENNQLQVTVPMQVAPVDLVVDDISDSLPSQIVQSDEVTTRVTVRNAGSGDIRVPFWVQLVVNGVSVGDQWVDSLSAGESKTLAFRWRAFAADSLQMLAIVDSWDNVPETDETNNRLQRQVVTQVVARQEVQVTLQPLSVRAAAGATVNYLLQISNQSRQSRSLRLQLEGLDGLSTSLQPTAVSLLPWASSSHALQVQIPADAAAGTREFTVRVLNEDDTPVTERRASLEVTREPQINALLPASGTRTGSTSVVFTWRTDVFASSEVFLRATDESNYRSFTGTEGTEHQVKVDGLQRGKTYRFYVVSRTAQGAAQSEERTLTVTEAVAFAQREYRFNVDKDFDQRVRLQLVNLSDSAQTARVELVNPYEDVPAGFIGIGGDQTVTLPVNGRQDVTLAMHFQTATRNRYTFVARLYSGEGANASMDEVPVQVTVDDNVDVEIQDLGTDPVTLQKTIRIVNRRNKPVAGLTLELSDELKGMVALDQELQNFRLGPYESITVRMQPVFAVPISRYPELRARLAPGRAVLLDIPEARQQLSRQRVGSIRLIDANKRELFDVERVDFTPPPGKNLFMTLLKNRKLTLQNSAASCSNQGRINVSFSAPSGVKPADPFLLVDLRPAKGWSGDQIAPQTAHFYVNGHLVGKLENTVPNGLYLFDVPAEFLRLGDFPTTNTVRMEWYLNNYGHFLQVANVQLVIFAEEMIQYVVAESEEEALRIAQNQPFFEQHDDTTINKVRHLLSLYGIEYREEWLNAQKLDYWIFEKILPLFGKDTPGEITDVVFGFENAVGLAATFDVPVLLGLITGKSPRLPVPMERFDCVKSTAAVLEKLDDLRLKVKDLRYAAVYTAKRDIFGNVDTSATSHNYALIWEKSAEDVLNKDLFIHNQKLTEQQLSEISQHFGFDSNNPPTLKYVLSKIERQPHLLYTLQVFYPEAYTELKTSLNQLSNKVYIVDFWVNQDFEMIAFKDALNKIKEGDTETANLYNRFMVSTNTLLKETGLNITHNGEWDNTAEFLINAIHIDVFNKPYSPGKHIFPGTRQQGGQVDFLSPPVFAVIVKGPVSATLRFQNDNGQAAGLLPNGEIADTLNGSRVYVRKNAVSILVDRINPDNPYRLSLAPLNNTPAKASLALFYVDTTTFQPHLEVYEDVPVQASRQQSGQVELNFDPTQTSQSIQLPDGRKIYPETSPVAPISPSTLDQPLVFEKNFAFPQGLQMIAVPQTSDSNIGELLETTEIARWNPDKQGNDKYELFPYPYVSTAQRGAGYWVKLDRTTPVTVTVATAEVQPYAISLRPGWNMIGNPYTEPVLWDANTIKVRKNGTELPLAQAEAQGWVEGYAWRWDGSTYRLVYSAGTPLPNVEDWLPAWSGAWVFAYEPCELILPIPQGIAAEITRKRGIAGSSTAPTGAWSIALRATANGSTQALPGQAQPGGEVIIGSLPNGRGLSVGVPPSPPRAQAQPGQAQPGSVQVVAVRQGQPLAADLRGGTRMMGEAWDIEVRVPAGESDTATLWWQDVYRAPRQVNPVLIDLQTGERRFLRHTSAHTFAISRQGGVYRFRVELLPPGDLLRITGVRVSGGRSQGSYTVSFNVNAGAQVEVKVLSAGKLVRRLMQTVTRSAGVQQVSWDGRDANGVALPAGAYLVEIKATGTDGQVARTAVPIVLTR